jgi:hypothetical protein
VRAATLKSSDGRTMSWAARCSTGHSSRATQAFGGVDVVDGPVVVLGAVVVLTAVVVLGAVVAEAMDAGEGAPLVAGDPQPVHAANMTTTAVTFLPPPVATRRMLPAAHLILDM